MVTHYTLWLRMPGDNRKTAAGWGKPVRLDITAPKGDNAVDVATKVWDALQRAGIEVLNQRP